MRWLRSTCAARGISRWRCAGQPEITEDDDEWAEELHAALDDQIDGSWSLHLAAAGHVSVLVAQPVGIWRRR
jgi:hypothetical protein